MLEPPPARKHVLFDVVGVPSFLGVLDPFNLSMNRTEASYSHPWLWPRHATETRIRTRYALDLSGTLGSSGGLETPVSAAGGALAAVCRFVSLRALSNSALVRCVSAITLSTSFPIFPTSAFSLGKVFATGQSVRFQPRTETGRKGRPWSGGSRTGNSQKVEDQRRPLDPAGPCRPLQAQGSFVALQIAALDRLYSVVRSVRTTFQDPTEPPAEPSDAYENWETDQRSNSRVGYRERIRVGHRVQERVKGSSRTNSDEEQEKLQIVISWSLNEATTVRRATTEAAVDE
ncbi:hypothetical protein DFP73DRAFT_600675 [Morchella snyderi]|nr:hypothetical protein DFP73DRAFT_600675 [Morchella snyderi]